MALRELQKLQGVRSVCLCLQVLSHELDFFVLPGKLKPISLQDIGLLLNYFVQVFQGFLNNLSYHILRRLALVLDCSDFPGYLVHLVLYHLLPLLEGSVGVACSCFR